MIDLIFRSAYGELFPNDHTKIVTKYKMMCKKVHPDVCGDPRAADAFARLTALYNQAIEANEKGIWEKPNYKEFKTTGGKTLQISYQYHCVFELGEYYVCKRNIIYAFDFSKKKYYNNYIKNIKNFHFANAGMEKMFKPILPQLVAEYDTEDNKHIIVLSKTEDVYPLRCVMDNFYKGNIPDTHLAWIMSRLMNLCCFLKYSGQVLNGLTIDNLFVSLQYHTILLEGGWWYAVDEDKDMIGTTKDIFNIMPPKVKANKVASSVTDVESVKAFGRKYLADSAPQAFKDFLNSGSQSDSMKEMAKWDEALEKSYGKRRFIKIEATENDIYKKERN